MNKYFCTIILILSLFYKGLAQKPVTDPNGSWTLLTDYSDEFNATTGLDVNKWDNDINDWGVWSWEPQNVWIDGTGLMHIKMVNEEHVRGGNTYYFKSGAARQKKTITYGYFEASVKGCPTFPGVCPAFWMYSSQQSLNNVTYNEIDFMEVQQRQYNIKGIDCNTHYSINGGAWVDTKNFYDAPFATNDGFHVYGCNVTPTDITFFIDGVQVAKNDNQYFILPMKVILSMGVRPPLMEYGTSGEKLPVVVLNNPGFPTEMLVDYVRVWQKTTAVNTVVEKNNTSQINVFPNPLKNNTTIKFSTKAEGNVKLSILDLKGQIIIIPINQYKQAGTHSINLNVNDIFGDGVYICKLETNNKVYSTKLIVLK